MSDPRGKRPAAWSGERGEDWKALALPLDAYVAAENQGATLQLEHVIEPAMLARLTAGKQIAALATETQLGYFEKRRRKLEEEGMQFLHQVAVPTEHVDYLTAEWGFKSRSELVRVALAYLFKHTREGLKTIDLGA